MNTHPDFEELLRLFEEQAVDYMIVGGYAVAWHGYPRFTKDLDIFFLASSDNVCRLRRALTAFGFAEEDLMTSSRTSVPLPGRKTKRTSRNFYRVGLGLSCVREKVE